jgi:hypothetical protein
MTVFKDICYGESYTSNGEEKKKWTKVGTLIEKEGKQYVKLQFVPLTEGEVFLSVFEPRQQGQQQGSQQQGGDPFSQGERTPF